MKSSDVGIFRLPDTVVIETASGWIAEAKGKLVDNELIDMIDY